MTGSGRSSKSQRQAVRLPSWSKEALPSRRTGVAGRDEQVGAGGGDRRRVDRDLELVDVEGFRQAGLVAHGELDPLQAGGGEGVGDALPVRLGAVGEGPGPAGDGAVGIDRARAVEGDLLAGGGDEVGAGVGDRRGVDAHGHGVAGGVERRAAVVADDEGDLVGAGAGVGVADVAPARGDAVAEVPVPGGDAAVGVGGAAAVEGELADRDRLVGAGVGDRCGADGDVDRRRRGGRGGGAVVGDGEGDRIDPGSGPGVLRLLAFAGGAVAEVPGPGEDRAVGVGRAAARRVGAISPTAIGRSGPVATGTGGALTSRVTVSVVVALATPLSSVTVRVAVKVPGVGIGVGDGGAVGPGAVAEVPVVAVIVPSTS